MQELCIIRNINVITWNFPSIFRFYCFPLEIYFLPEFRHALAHTHAIPQYILPLVFSCSCALLRLRHLQWHSSHALSRMQRDNSNEFQQLQQNHFKCVDFYQFVGRIAGFIACQPSCIGMIRRVKLFCFCHFAHDDSDQSEYRDSQKIIV